MPYTTLAMHQLLTMANDKTHNSAYSVERPTPVRRPVRHVRIEFGSLQLDYRAPAERAQDVAGQLAQSILRLLVSVDDQVRSDLPTLPCAELWN